MSYTHLYRLRKLWRKFKYELEKTVIPFSGSHPTSASYRTTMVSEVRYIFNINDCLSVQHITTSTSVHKHQAKTTFVGGMQKRFSYVSVASRLIKMFSSYESLFHGYLSQNDSFLKHIALKPDSERVLTSIRAARPAKKARR